MSSDAQELVSQAQRLRQQGRFADARNASERALAIEPDNAPAWFNLGACLGGLSELAAAEAAYRRALELDPRYPEAWSNLGGILGAKGAIEEQLAAYRKALAENPLLAPVWSNLGNALCNARRHAEAENASRRAVELEPRFVPGWLNLGRALHEMKRTAEARAACQRAVELAPDLADAWAGLGNALMGMREFSGAIESYRKAVSLRPQNSDFHTNLGIALWRVGSDVESEASLRMALKHDPGNDFASWYLATSLLRRGELAEGWARYETRWERPDSPPRRYGDKGGPPLGGSALLWGEQGVGDHILHARMALEAAQAGAAVTLETDARLVMLFRRSFPELTVIAQTEPPQMDPVQFDHVLPLGSLGRLMRSSFDAFPRHRGYLLADAARSKRCREVLKQMLPRNSLIVGIAWRSANVELANEKSAPLREWAPLFKLPGVSFVNLQYGDVAQERRDAEGRFGIRIATVPEIDVLGDLDGLAALLGACDLVITTSSVSAHLAGALGLPGWVLLPKRIGAIWYWFGQRDDSPWYPSLTLIRQSDDGEWSGAMELAAGRLRERLGEAS